MADKPSCIRLAVPPCTSLLDLISKVYAALKSLAPKTLVKEKMIFRCLETAVDEGL